MTTTNKRQRRWLARFRAGSKGIKALSVGAYPHDACKACDATGLDLSTAATLDGAIVGAPVDECSECDGKGRICECSSCSDFDPDIGDEGSFSWSECECCGSSLGGTRHAAHGLISRTKYGRKTVLIHLDVCTDCLMFIANGDLPGED